MGYIFKLTRINWNLFTLDVEPMSMRIAACMAEFTQATGTGQKSFYFGRS